MPKRSYHFNSLLWLTNAVPPLCSIETMHTNYIVGNTYLKSSLLAVNYILAPAVSDPCKPHSAVYLDILILGRSLKVLTVKRYKILDHPDVISKMSQLGEEKIAEYHVNTNYLKEEENKSTVAHPRIKYSKLENNC